jgi:hypothetical protein
MRGDTREDAARVMRERTARMTPGERIEEGLRASIVCRHVMRAGIRSRHPEYSREEVEDALARLLWGEEIFRGALPGRPLLDP